VLRFLLWRILAAVSGLAALAFLAALLDGAIGRALRSPGSGRAAPEHPAPTAAALLEAVGTAVPGWLGATLALLLCSSGAVLLGLRARARGRRRYERLRVTAYRTDSADAISLARAFAALHAGLATRWWRRLTAGQSSVAVEAHYLPASPGRAAEAWLAVSCPTRARPIVEAALRAAYPNVRLEAAAHEVGAPPVILRLTKQRRFIERISTGNRLERDPEPAMNRLLTAMAACGQPVFTQIALTPAPASLERLARHRFKEREARLSHERREHASSRDRSLVEETELRGGLEIQHRSLYFADIRVLAASRGICEQVASVLRTDRAENRLVERGTVLRHELLGLYTRRVWRGEGNPLPSPARAVFTPAELAELWQLPSVDYTAVPFRRGGLPLAPAPPDVFRPADGGTLRDALGPVSIHPDLRRQNTAVPGTVEQGKSSFLVASFAEDLRRPRCAVILLDPKGDAAEAALSTVPVARACTLLDFADPTCGFNPLAVDAPADVIADYVVGALKNLFSDADIRASSDRYLRNAIIAVVSSDRSSTLWDAARLLSVGEEGYAYRREIGARVRGLPELKEISSFFTGELTAQLADARSATTSKLDAPVNKLARLLNSASIKRVLLNESLRLDFDRVIAEGEVLVVKGALGRMGAGNTSVLMQLLIGMLDAALARQQDLVPSAGRVAVALKIDEAPLILNRGFAETMALKRSAGLETVACWQTDAQWVDREVRDQLDALFAHRVYFATASARDARSAVDLTMAEFSDTVRPGFARLSALGHPDVRLRLPRHHAIASWTTHDGRQGAFVAETIPMRIDPRRLAALAAAQAARGGRRLTDLRQPHWDAAGRSDAAGTTVGEPDGRSPVSAPPSVAAEPAAPASPSEGRQRPRVVPALPERLADSYRELLDLDRASRARRSVSTAALDGFRPDAGDLRALTLIGTFGHVLSSQVHRWLDPQRAVTTTQRRLKRLADAGLVERFQFHRPDGGGVPMCYALSPAGLLAVQAAGGRLSYGGGPSLSPEQSDGGSGLRRARHELHVAGWALAVAQLTGARELRGAGESVLPPAPAPGGRLVAPAELRLPGGRIAHDFLRTIPSGERVEATRFDTLRPDATIVCGGSTGVRAHDVLVERDDRVRSAVWLNKLERYDHFLTGWSAQTVRYGTEGAATPVVVFVCRDRARARDCARRADAALTAARAYGGDYPHSWEYCGRRATLFVAERDVHERSLCAWGVPDLPPALRVAASSDDRGAGEGAATGPFLIPIPLAERLG
jgi:Replication-relaxation